MRQPYIAGLGLPYFDPGHFRPRALTILLALERLDVGDDGVDLCAGQVELGHRWVGIGEPGAQTLFRDQGIVGDRLEGGAASLPPVLGATIWQEVHHCRASRRPSSGSADAALARAEAPNKNPAAARR